jgi:hypothetical protein
VVLKVYSYLIYVKIKKAIQIYVKKKKAIAESITG